MRRIVQPVRREVESTRLRLSDLQTIVEIIGEGDASKVEVMTDEFEDLTVEKLILEDLKSKYIWFRRVRGNDNQDTIDVVVSRDRVLIQCVDTDKYHSMAVSILRLAESRRMTRGRRGESVLVAAVAAVSSVIAVVVIFSLKTYFKANRLAVMPVAVAPSFLLVLVVLLRRRGREYVRFRREDEQPVKWRAVVWDLTKILFGAAAGTGLTLYFKR
jgi:hypothetical protein